DLKAVDTAKGMIPLAEKVTPIVRQAHDLGFGTPEANTLTEKLTTQEYAAYGKIKTILYGATGKENNVSEPPTFAPGTTHNDTSLIGSVVAYAKAFGTDPLTAFNRIFTGQRIVRVDNGAVIVERMDVAKSQREKKQLGGGKDVTLDH